MCTISSSSSSSSVLQRKSPHTEGAWEALAKNTPFGLNNLSLTTSHSRGWWRGFTQYAQRSQIFFHDSFRLPWTLKREFRHYPPLIPSSSLSVHRKPVGQEVRRAMFTLRLWGYHTLLLWVFVLSHAIQEHWGKDTLSSPWSTKWSVRTDDRGENSQLFGESTLGGLHTFCRLWGINQVYKGKGPLDTIEEKWQGDQ